MTLRIVRPLGRSDGLEVDDLFPDFHKYGSDHRRRQYVEARLVEMARNNTLYLTDILNHAASVWQMAGFVILGHGIKEDHNFTAGIKVPSELLSYKVHVRSLNGSDIRWCRDMVPGDPIVKGKATLADGQDMPLQNFRVIEEWVETDSTDTMLDLQDAWMCLRQCGKHCRPAKRSGLQEKYWTVEEVRPEGMVGSDEEKKRGPGRPAKQSFSQANQ